MSDCCFALSLCGNLIIFHSTPPLLFQASNLGAQALYSKLGFVKDEKMSKYYLNNGDAYRLKLWIDKDPKLTGLAVGSS